MRQLIVVGAGGHATSVAESALAMGFEILAFVDAESPAGALLGMPVVSSIPEGHAQAGGSVIVAIGDNYVRESVTRDLRLRYPRAGFPAIIHPSASVSRFASVGDGSVVLQGAVIAAGTQVGSFAVVNTSASIDHDCLIDDFASVAPGATLGGRVSVGQGAAISIAAVIKHGVTVGSHTVIGGSSYVDRTVPPLVVAYGVPAKVIRSRAIGDSYL